MIPCVSELIYTQPILLISLPTSEKWVFLCKIIHLEWGLCFVFGIDYLSDI